MGKKAKPDEFASSDIFSLLVETSEKERRKRREELLAPLGVKEFFVGGSITIDKRTCKGVECKLCIKACPTNALYWRATGDVGITEELCVYCGACVLNCIVDNCIKITRKRENGEIEKFSTPRAFTILEHGINAKKRLERVRSVFPTVADYLKLYKPLMT
jgi:Fe-S-cluster-containing dehydrogenase component